jgi:hypothetical protein
LSAAKVLIIGGDGLAAEVCYKGFQAYYCDLDQDPVPLQLQTMQVAKNIVLAGVGTVAIADDTPCSQANPGNFLIQADVSPTTT